MGVLPGKIKEAADKAMGALIPEASKERYLNAYWAFKNFQKDGGLDINDPKNISQEVLLVYASLLIFKFLFFVSTSELVGAVLGWQILIILVLLSGL